MWSVISWYCLWFASEKKIITTITKYFINYRILVNKDLIVKYGHKNSVVFWSLQCLLPAIQKSLLKSTYKGAFLILVHVIRVGIASAFVLHLPLILKSVTIEVYLLNGENLICAVSYVSFLIWIVEICYINMGFIEIWNQKCKRSK